MSLVYLASPYTSTDPKVRAARVEAACRHTAALLEEGHPVFSPVAHSHGICDYLKDDRRLDPEFWMLQDLAVLEHCTKVVVLMLPGWDQSRGVGREIAEAAHRGIEVEYREPWA